MATVTKADEPDASGAGKHEPKPEPQPGRLRWVVVYPAIHVQPKDKDGNPSGELKLFAQGDVLSEDCEWAALQLRTFGHVTGIQGPA